MRHVGSFDERVLPTRELYGEGELKETTRRHAIVDSIRHAALRLTRDHIAGQRRLSVS